MKFCLDKNIHFIENIDGSADIFQILNESNMQNKKKTDIFDRYTKKHKKYLYRYIFLSIFVAYLPVISYCIYENSFWSSNK